MRRGGHSPQGLSAAENEMRRAEALGSQAAMGSTTSRRRPYRRCAIQIVAGIPVRDDNDALLVQAPVLVRSATNGLADFDGLAEAGYEQSTPETPLVFRPVHPPPTGYWPLFALNGTRNPGCGYGLTRTAFDLFWDPGSSGIPKPGLTLFHG